MVVRHNDREDTFELQSFARVVHHRTRRLKSKPFAPIVRQKSETDVGVRQFFAFKQTAQADGNGRVFEFDEIQAKAVSRVTRHWTVEHVLSCVFEVADVFIVDVTKERRFVEERENKLRVVERELAQN